MGLARSSRSKIRRNKTAFFKKLYMFLAAMDQITRVMAAELGPHQIRTNAINPTVTLTPMGAQFWGQEPEKAAKMKARIPLGKFADPEDVVNGIIFLLSE